MFISKSEVMILYQVFLSIVILSLFSNNFSENFDIIVNRETGIYNLASIIFFISAAPECQFYSPTIPFVVNSTSHRFSIVSYIEMKIPKF